MRFKRIAALLLSLAMVLSLIPTAAFADTTGLVVEAYASEAAYTANEQPLASFTDASGDGVADTRLSATQYESVYLVAKYDGNKVDITGMGGSNYSSSNNTITFTSATNQYMTSYVEISTGHGGMRIDFDVAAAPAFTGTVEIYADASAATPLYTIPAGASFDLG